MGAAETIVATEHSPVFQDNVGYQHVLSSRMWRGLGKERPFLPVAEPESVLNELCGLINVLDALNMAITRSLDMGSHLLGRTWIEQDMVGTSSTVGS